MEEKVQPVELSVEALRQGDRAEFARLVERYSAPIYRLALRIVSNEQDAEDVLQETFLKAFRSLSKFEGRSSLTTWLYRIAVNESLMLLRQRRPQAISIDEDTEGEEGPLDSLEIVDWCCLPEDELMDNEARKYLDEAINRLPKKLQIVFILRDIEDLSIRDTADTLNLSETAVKTRLLRARLYLRKELSTYYRERLAEMKRR
jgi:RNA polymerase sigma-70 factor (ECF subfamily)